MKQRKPDAGFILKNSNGHENCNQSRDKRAEFRKTVHECNGLEPQSRRQHDRHQNNRQQAEQHGSKMHRIICHGIHDDAADKAANGRRDDTNQDSARQQRTIFLLNQCQGNRNIKQQNTAHGASNDNARKLSHDDVFSRQLDSERITAGVRQQQCRCKNGR